MAVNLLGLSDNARKTASAELNARLCGATFCIIMPNEAG